VEGKPALLFMGEAVSILKEIFFNIDKIKIDWKKFNIYEKQIEVLEEEFGQSARDIDYGFISPWKALNETNFQIPNYLALEKQSARGFV
jgi:hypothetical protein